MATKYDLPKPDFTKYNLKSEPECKKWNQILSAVRIPYIQAGEDVINKYYKVDST